MVQNYRDLEVWQIAMQLAEAIFKLTDSFPKTQQYVLVAQMQRCALSMPSNIAEGRSRHSKNDFIYHLNIARGSLAELETQLELSVRLGFIENVENITELTNRMTRMLFGLRNSLLGNNQKAVTGNPKPVTEELV